MDGGAAHHQVLQANYVLNSHEACPTAVHFGEVIALSREFCRKSRVERVVIMVKVDRRELIPDVIHFSFPSVRTEGIKFEGKCTVEIMGEGVYAVERDSAEFKDFLQLHDRVMKGAANIIPWNCMSEESTEGRGSASRSMSLVEQTENSSGDPVEVNNQSVPPGFEGARRLKRPVNTNRGSTKLFKSHVFKHTKHTARSKSVAGPSKKSKLELEIQEAGVQQMPSEAAMDSEFSNANPGLQQQDN